MSAPKEDYAVLHRVTELIRTRLRLREALEELLATTNARWDGCTGRAALARQAAELALVETADLGRRKRRARASATPPTFSVNAEACSECGHQHGGPEIGGVCVGCPCTKAGA